MLLKSTASKAFVSEGLETSTIGVRANKLGLISEICRNSIYTKKHLAPVRELIANAIEVHHEHKVDKPIDVFLDEENRSFTIRDYAKGLCKRNVFETWGMYFESTKNNDEINELGYDGYIPMGGFGVGSKAMFCLTENAIVTSHFQGKKTMYYTFIDRGETGNGECKISVTHEEPSDESGMEISFEVESSSDFYQLKVEALKVESELRPETKLNLWIDGVLIEDTRSEEFSKYDWGKIFYADNRRELVRIRMGDICYDFPNEREWIDIRDNIDRKMEWRTIIDVPVNTFTVPIHRETVDASTRNLRLMKEIYNSIEKRYEKTKSKLKLSFGDLVQKEAVVKDEFIYSFTNLLGTRRGFQKHSTGFRNLVVAIPNNRATSDWQTRLGVWANQQDLTVYSIVTNDPDKFEKKLRTFSDETFEFKQVKKLGLSKFEKREVKGTFVFLKGSYNREKMTVKEFHESFAPSTFSVSKVDSLVGLYEKCIYINDGSRPSGWRCCKTACEELRKLGWLDPNSKRVTKKAEQLRKKEEEQRERTNKVWEIERKRYLTDRTKKAAKNKTSPHLIDRLYELVHEMEGENSTAGRFLRSVKSGWDVQLSREEIRDIYKKIK